MDKRLFSISSLALLTGFLTTFLFLHSTIPVRAASSLPEGVVMSFRMPSPYALAQKLVTIAREIEPGPQADALPFLFGMALGDPMLQGIDREESVSLYLVSTGDAIAPVLMLKLTNSGPYRQTLPQLGLQLHDHDGWTFATLQTMPFEIDEEIRTRLLSSARAPRENDLDLRVSGRQLGLRLLALEEDGNALLEPFLGEGNGAVLDSVRPLARMLGEELLEVVSMGMAVNLDADLISPSAHLEGTQGSALGNFLSHEVPVSTELAGWIDADEASWVYLTNLSPEALGTYSRHLFERVEEGFLKPLGEEGVVVGKIVRDLMERYLENVGSSSVGSLRPFGSMDDLALETFQMSETRMSDEALAGFLREAVALSQRKSVGAFFDRMGEESDGAGSAESLVRLIESDRTVGDVPVHSLHMGGDFSGEEAEVSRNFGSGTEAVYFAVVEGFLLQSTSFETIVSHIEAVQAGEKPTGSAAGEFTEKPGTVSQFYLDASPFFRLLENEGLEGSRPGLDLPKVRGDIVFQNNTAVLGMNVPVKLIGELYRQFQLLSEQESK